MRKLLVLLVMSLAMTGAFASAVQASNALPHYGSGWLAVEVGDVYDGFEWCAPENEPYSCSFDVATDSFEDFDVQTPTTNPRCEVSYRLTIDISGNYVTDGADFGPYCNGWVLNDISQPWTGEICAHPDGEGDWEYWARQDMTLSLRTAGPGSPSAPMAGVVFAKLTGPDNGSGFIEATGMTIDQQILEARGSYWFDAEVNATLYFDGSALMIPSNGSVPCDWPELQ